ncbi:MAG: hypothetical protein WA139_06200 [Candidatus Aenigmatarchaeota archaeon]
MFVSEVNNNLFLMPEYVNSVKEELKKGKTAKFVIGRIDYNAIQKDETFKREYETLIKSYPKFFVMFNPELPKDSQKIIVPGQNPCIMSHNRETASGEAGHVSLRKAAQEIEKADNYFKNGVVLSDFNAPLNDLVKKFNENKSGKSQICV